MGMMTFEQFIMGKRLTIDRPKLFKPVHPAKLFKPTYTGMPVQNILPVSKNINSIK